MNSPVTAICEGLMKISCSRFSVSQADRLMMGTKWGSEGHVKSEFPTSGLPDPTGVLAYRWVHLRCSHILQELSVFCTFEHSGGGVTGVLTRVSRLLIIRLQRLAKSVACCSALPPSSKKPSPSSKTCSRTVWKRSLRSGAKM